MQKEEVESLEKEEKESAVGAGKGSRLVAPEWEVRSLRNA